jgi:HYR domain/Sushi repeat (SCR repeat)
MVGKILAGERCVLHCAAGFKPFGKRTAVCDTAQNWQPSDELYCVPVESEAVNIRAPTVVAVAKPIAKPIAIVKPVIRCPQDITVMMPKNQKLVHIRLDRPQTNVDWDKYVDTNPAWGKNLEAQLPVGITTVTFRARGPQTNLNDICRVVITVKGGCNLITAAKSRAD